METYLVIISALYLASGLITILGYTPTIRDLIKGELTANVKTYAIWTATQGISFIYALAIVQDLLLVIIFAFHFILCATIFMLTVKLNTHTYKKHLEK